MINLFALTEQEELEQEQVSTPQFVSKDDGSYIVVARFRNRQDYENFVTLIGQPKLKAHSKVNMLKINYPEQIDQETTLEFLLQD